MNNISTAPVFDIPSSIFTVETGHSSSCLISDETFSTYRKILQKYSDNTIDEADWVIPYMEGLKTCGIHFGGLDVSEDELRLIKAYVVDTLSHYSSPSTCVKRLKYLTYLFKFLHAKHFTVRMLSGPVINMFRQWLDTDNNLTASKKNNIESVLRSFVPFLQSLELARPGNIVLPRARPVAGSDVVRAPEIAVMQRLDKYFFDFTNPIPTAYRCIYLVARLIPVRNNEVLNIAIDGFEVEDGLLELWIPTCKETPNHNLIYEPYYRLANEYPECIMVRALQEQQSFALEHQSRVTKPAYRGRLMVSNKNPTRLVTSQDFNAYLKNMCKELGIVDHTGLPVTPTLYSLRHANGWEMSCNPEISSDEFTRVFSHASQEADEPYSYGNKHDELKRTAQATQDVRTALTSAIAASETETRKISQTRFKKMRKDCDTHLIGSNSVCQQQGCTPQLYRCVKCDNYIPDPKYIPDAEACCENIRHRIKICEQQGRKELLEFNKRQLDVYTTFISRAQAYAHGEGQ